MSTAKVLFVLIIIIDAYVKPAQACAAQPEHHHHHHQPKTTPKPKRTTANVVDKNLPHAWGGFQLPEKLKTKWKNWLTDYKERMKQQGLENDEQYKKGRGPGSGWPDSWQGIGGGHGGDEPPPWSYQPINQGLPEFCYQPPIRGACPNAKVTKRWAYNPYIDECVEFDYACDGNQNNFDKKDRCVKMCMIEPVIGCDIETSIYIDN